MIRFYAYYNHGGYKDFYVGTQEETVTSKYFLPLLVVHEATLKNEPENEELRRLVEHQKQLPKLVMLSDATAEYNYPKEARVLMSHGGYKVLYKRLTINHYALAIRDIVGSKDVYGRQSPFNMMFIGDEEDLDNMDILVEYVRNNLSSFTHLLSTLFVNDLNENGLRCDIDRLTSALHSILENGEHLSYSVSQSLPVRLLVVSSAYNLNTTFKEQNMNRRDICMCFDETGNRLFASGMEQSSANNDTTSTTIESERIGSQSYQSEKHSHLSLHGMTNTPKLEDIDKIWDYIRGMERANVQKSKRIDELEKRINELENNRQ